MTVKLISKRAVLILAMAGSFGLAGVVVADVGNDNSAVIVKSVERTRGEKKDVAWLGVAVEEAPESLTTQLDLKPGEGLVVTMVASNSPAFIADVHKFDVLVEFEGQMLVDEKQLRKLVRMHPQGDVVKLTLYRGGKKVLVSATLGQTTLESASLDEDAAGSEIKLDMSGLNQVSEEFKAKLAPLQAQQRKLKLQLEHANQESREAEADVQRSIVEVKRALERMMKEHPRMNVLATEDKDISQLADNGVSLDSDATVTVKQDMNSAKSILKTDDSGVYVIVEDPKKHLTAHDHDGKLLFDGDIETTEEQQKVPRAVWEKVKPMLDQLGNVILTKPQSKTNLLQGGAVKAPSSDLER